MATAPGARPPDQPATTPSAAALPAGPSRRRAERHRVHARGRYQATNRLLRRRPPDRCTTPRVGVARIPACRCTCPSSARGPHHVSGPGPVATLRATSERVQADPESPCRDTPSARAGGTRAVEDADDAADVPTRHAPSTRRGPRGRRRPCSRPSAFDLRGGASASTSSRRTRPGTIRRSAVPPTRGTRT